MRLLSASISFLTLAGSFAIVAAPKAIAENTVPYPAEVVQIFTDTCVSQGNSNRIPPAVMREICSCNIREIQKTYTLEEFTKIGTALGEGKEPPAGFQEMVEGCVVEVLQK